MNPNDDNDELTRPGFFLTLTLALGLIGGVALDRVAVGGIDSLHAAADLRLISEAWRTVQSVYVDRAAAQPRTMTYGAISGMVDALGDTGHSRFLSPEMVKALNDIQRNKFEGIGAEIQIKEGQVVIVAPLDNSPAQRAGLRTGDIILKVNDNEVTALPLDQVAARVSGTCGHIGDSDDSESLVGPHARGLSGTSLHYGSQRHLAATAWFQGGTPAHSQLRPGYDR